MVRVFCDFDGTVSQQDVGEEFFRSFAGEKADANVHRLLNNEITAQQWLTDIVDSIPSISQELFLKYMDKFSLDPHFAEFVRFCGTSGIPITILSDGLDAYIASILSRAGLPHVPFYANHAEWKEEKLRVTFPFTDDECHACGNCKRNHMLNISADDDILIYVGDGYSDRCPVRYADFVFAKRQLIKHCQHQNISYFAFNHFGDVHRKVEEIAGRKRIRPRQEAVLARRDVFIQG